MKERGRNIRERERKAEKKQERRGEGTDVSNKPWTMIAHRVF